MSCLIELEKCELLLRSDPPLFESANFAVTLQRNL